MSPISSRNARPDNTTVIGRNNAREDTRLDNPCFEENPFLNVLLIAFLIEAITRAKKLGNLILEKTVIISFIFCNGVLFYKTLIRASFICLNF